MERMKAGTFQVADGVRQAGIAGESLGTIVAGTSQVASMIQCISAAAEEAGAGASQSASAAVTLSTKAEELRGLVKRFRVNA
ncbi:MAG: hypothetical protein H7Y88_07310 [Phycisphaerales bacterium]|nr:hypothetical protein [Phycisphaerales bacterium]